LFLRLLFGFSKLESGNQLLEDSVRKIGVQAVHLLYVPHFVETCGLAQIVKNKLVLKDPHFVLRHSKALKSLLNFSFCGFSVIFLFLQELRSLGVNNFRLQGLFLHFLTLFVLFDGLEGFADELLEEFEGLEPVASPHDVRVGLAHHLLKVFVASYGVLEDAEVVEGLGELAAQQRLVMRVELLLAAQLEGCIMQEEHVLVFIDMLGN